MDKPTLALSIKQPWAWLICKGYKDIENRDWFVGGKVASKAVNFSIQLPLRIYIHGSKQPDYSWETEDYIHDRTIVEQEIQYIKTANNLPLGAIIGEVTITGCVDKSESPWFVGKYGFILADPILYDKPIPCKGMLGFFKPEIREVRI